MPQAETRVDDGASVDSTASLGEGVVVERGAIIGPNCRIGARTRVRAGAIIVEHSDLGEDNDVHPGAVVGGDPQDRKFDRSDDVGRLTVGDRNVIREHVTLNRGAGAAGPTVIGSDCYFMTTSHVGHNTHVGDGCVLTNGAAIGGHARVGERCVLSSHAVVHQFCTVGEYVMFQAHAGVGMHVPPYVIVERLVNCVAGLNYVGLRRSGQFDAADLAQIKEVYRLLYRASAPMTSGLEEARAQRWRPAAQRFIDFIDEALQQAPPRARGVCRGLETGRARRGRVPGVRENVQPV